jgi:TonB-dependent starch-binding outer membrane protein SusC
MNQLFIISLILTLKPSLMIKKTKQSILKLKYFKEFLLTLGLCAMLLALSTTTSYAAPASSAMNAGEQQKQVTGRITDSNGSPLGGAVVLEKGTSNGVMADNDGFFSIKTASAKPVLVISMVGFTAQEIEVGSQSVINVTLAEALSALDEVVVVGYGTVKKKDLTGSVSSISEEKLKTVQTPNVLNQLKGRSAGVDIISNGAGPGASSQIRIRGEHSLSKVASPNADGTPNTSATTAANDAANAPLLVVDGIPYGGNINDIAPSDILSIDILKDASATAIYGSRGSGGVILITTKRGSAGKAVVSYDAYFGVSKVLDELHVFNGQELADFKTQAQAQGGSTNYALTADETANLEAGISTDWQDLIYQNGFTSDQQLGISGGTEDTQYSMGIGYLNETGVIPNQRYERYNVRTTLDHQVNKRIKIGLNSINTLSYSNIAGNPVGSCMNMSPLSKPYNDDGSIKIFPMTLHTDELAYVNPLTIDDTENIYNNVRRLRTFNSLYGELKIFEFLKYRINVGLDFSTTKSGSFYGPNTLFNAGTTLATARVNVGNSEGYSWTVENLLIFDKTFKEKHRVGFTALYSAQKDHAQASNFNATGVIANIVQNSNMAYAQNLTAAKDGSNYLTDKGLISYMARVNYAFDNRYLMTASIRRDGASVLSPGHQFTVYPAAAIAWNASNESFMKGLPVLSNLKLRAGWGKTANAGISAYSTLGALSTYDYNFGSNGVTGFIVTNLGNKDLKWETTSQYNAGIDFGLLGNRITGSIDVYQQHTDDILLNMSLPASMGASTIMVNAGKTKGKGIEIALGGVVIENLGGLRWTADLTFAINRNEVVQLLNKNSKEDVGNGWFVGQPINVIYDVKKIGIWQTADDAARLAQTAPVQKVGSIRIEDHVVDNKIDASDRQIIGNFDPKWTGGLSSTWSFKGVDLSVVMYARMGMKVVCPYLTADGGSQGYPMFMQGRRNQLKVDYWTPTNPTNKFPSPDNSIDRPQFGSTLGYVDGSFIKVRSINLGYNIPSNIVGKAGISSLRVYVNVLNPFILYSPFVKEGYGPDPEGNGYGGVVNSVNAGSTTPVTSRVITVNANVPTTRQFNIGLNVKF